MPFIFYLFLVPLEIEHTVIWSRVPIFHPALIPSLIEARIQQDGLCGFTGSNTPAEHLPSLESCLPALAEWGVTADSIRIPRGSEEDEEMVRNAGKEVSAFVKRRWKEGKWETAWFVNPPVRPLPVHLSVGWLIVAFRDCRAFPDWHIYMSLLGRSPRKKPHHGMHKSLLCAEGRHGWLLEATYSIL